MRLDARPTLPELRPAFVAYSGPALVPFLRARHVTQERLAECVEIAVTARDAEGARLARLLFRLSANQRQELRRSLLTAGLTVS